MSAEEKPKEPICRCACCSNDATHRAKDGTRVCEDCGPGYAFLLAKRKAGIAPTL